MALFGSKKKGDATSAPSAGAPAAGAPASSAPTRATVVKDKKARPVKGAVKNGTITGLNIGNAAIKAVEVTAKNGQLSVTRLASVATPPDAFQNGNVLSVTSLSNAIKALWKTGGFKSNAVISSVSGTGALVVRVIEVPLMTDAQLADAMRADAQLYIPFPPTEVQMDFKALRELPSDPDAGTMDVLLAAAQSEIIDLHIKTLQAARLDPRAVDVEPIAVGRTLSLQKRAESGGAPPDYNEISAIANIGAFGTEISLLRGDVLVFTRTISAGGNSISQTIADALGVPLAEGERLKIEQGDALAPEGYNGANADDDFGFGDDFGGQNAGFGGEFDDFGLGAQPSATPNATTVLDAPAQTSSDPFDLDLFNQGPKSEPGAGHGQKEGEPPAGAFSFDDLLSSLPSQPGVSAGGSQETPALGQKTPSFNFDFDLPTQDLPTMQETAGTPSTPASPTTRVALADEFNVSGGLLPPSSEVVAQSNAPMASAFDFSDFDLPSTAPTASVSAPTAASPSAHLPATTSEAPAALTQTMAAAPAPVAPAFTSGGFSFDEPEETPVSTPTPEAIAPLSFEPLVGEEAATATPQVAMNPASESRPLDGGFDLDTVFGEPQPEAALPSPQMFPANSGLQPGTVTHVATVPASSLVPEGLAVEGLNLGEDNFDFGGTGEDVGSFGVGLSGGNGLDGASLYGALAPALDELSNEIARSLSFYLERVPDAALSRIYLTGGGALLKNLDVYLTGRLGAPTSLFNPLQLLPVNAPASPLTTQGPLYTVALGLALRDFVD